MTAPFRLPHGRSPGPVCAALLALALTGCAEESPSGAASPASTAPVAGAAAEATAASGAPEGPAPSAVPSGHDVAPYGDGASREAAADFGSTQQLTGSLEAVVEGPRPETTGERAVRAAPGTPVQVFTLTLTNTGTEPADAVAWSFPVAVAGEEPATPAFDESLGVRMETFPTLAPGESSSLEVAFSAAHDADLAVRVFDNTEPDHYVEFTD